jgi:threonine dehydratase
LAESGKVSILPFDDEQVIAGQGTIGLEILEEVPGVKGNVIPVGGGGLISGIGTIVKKKRPQVKIIGAQAVQAPSAFYFLRKKRIVEAKVKPTLAEGISIQKVGEITFRILLKRLDEIVTVQEDEIASAILMLMERKRVVAEGAGAAPLAASLSGRWRIRPKKIVLDVSGGNIDVNLLDRIIEKGLSQTGRLVRFGVLLRDLPGSLAELSSLVARYPTATSSISYTSGPPKTSPSDSPRSYWSWRPVGRTTFEK